MPADISHSGIRKNTHRRMIVFHAVIIGFAIASWQVF
jgi:hypothetical protein